MKFSIFQYMPDSAAKSLSWLTEHVGYYRKEPVITLFNRTVQLVKCNPTLGEMP